MSHDRSHDRNAVRDRTLVLRVLVPGLHTSLNDKINAKKEGAELPTPSSSSAAQNSQTRMTADQLLNLDGVTCMPSSSASTLWHFRCDGATYPARLVCLPCPIEVLKTHDHANYHKSADIGQMLIVYEDEYAMQEAENEKGYKVDGFPSYYHSGLTPPMNRVVQRRYLSRFEERETKPTPPPKAEVAEVEEELQNLITKFSSGKGKQKKGGSSSMTGKDKVVQEIEEEIVDYEPWMAEGRIFTVDDAKMHPEWWLSKAEMKEIDLVKREQAAVDEEKRRKEQKAAEEAEAARRAEYEKKSAEKEKKAERKKEKKKKKDREKKRQQQEDDEAAAAALAAAVGGDTRKKGIASLKNRDKQEAPVPEMDEVTAAAMAINETEEDLMFSAGMDDMFDFENEDITDLLG